MGEGVGRGEGLVVWFAGWFPLELKQTQGSGGGELQKTAKEVVLLKEIPSDSEDTTIITQ